MFSPGKLNAEAGSILGGVSSHAEIAGECKLCHTAPWESEGMDDRCNACHTNIPQEQGDLGTIHGKLYVLDPAAQCRECHPEHHGESAALTVIERWRFPHQVTGYLLDGHQKKGKNEDFLCADCHGEDVTTFNPLVCDDCHQQMDVAFMLDHHLAFGDTCLNCHDGVDTYGDDFSHDLFPFALTGSHLIALCSQCHQSSSNVADLQLTPKACNACHQVDDPHAGNLGDQCGDCHSTEGWKPAQFDHNLASFKLVGAHINVACEKCHEDFLFVGTPATCFACHQKDDFHDGSFGEECATCHNPSSWDDWIFDHDLAAFKLTGKHVNVDCESCHTSGYRGTPTDCFGCHQKDDQHNGQLGKDCGECHNTAGWGNVNFDHSQTGFSLLGQHATVACKACHANGQYRGTPKGCYSCHAADDAHGGQFGQDCGKCHVPSGWKNVTFNHNNTGFMLTGKHQNVSCLTCHKNGTFKGTPTNCYACHAANDAHNGQFGKDCGACHNTKGWGGATFNHGNTGFPLTGQHKNAACKSCHTNGVYKGTPSTCYACHANKDAHNGQFGKDCGACHNTNGWGGATFDHSNTGFPLTGQHSNTACNSCHGNGVYKGTPTACYSCHAKDDQHNGQFGKDCGACHSTKDWGGATFNHSNTGFPLTGQHKNLSCKSCHSNGYQGTPTNCYACHANDDQHGGSFGTNCGSCHNTSGWGNVSFDHNNTSFPLVGKHRNVSCESCHKNGVYQGTPKACVACHEDPHNGENGNKCGSCHTPRGWGD